MYRAREHPAILSELKSSSGVEASTIEGTFENDVLASNSLEFAKVEVELEQAYKAAFADTAWGEYLTRRAAEFGVDRKKATKAKVSLHVTGTGTVAAGSIFATADGLRFAAKEAVEITNEGRIDAVAMEPGTGGNVAAHTINTIPMNIPGILSVDNPKAAYDGFNEESDKELLRRFLIFVRTPATSGNAYHYYNWAMRVEGVGACRVFPLWAGAGTVKVNILDDNGRTASKDLKQAVFTYIESVRPIGATVTVASPAPKIVNLEADIDGTLDSERLKEELRGYIMGKGLDFTRLSAAMVIDKIMNQASVNDCANVKLNGGERVASSTDEILVVGEVKVHGFTS